MAITTSYQCSSSDLVPDVTVVGTTLAWWNMYLSLALGLGCEREEGGHVFVDEIYRGSREWN